MAVPVNPWNAIRKLFPERITPRYQIIIHASIVRFVRILENRLKPLSRRSRTSIIIPHTIVHEEEVANLPSREVFSIIVFIYLAQQRGNTGARVPQRERERDIDIHDVEERQEDFDN